MTGSINTVSGLRNRSRAYVKIEDGCDRFCSYCVIPFARGRVISKPAEEIISEVKNLLDSGYHEFTLTGINIALYGSDFVDDKKDEIAGQARNDAGLVRNDAGLVRNDAGLLEERRNVPNDGDLGDIPRRGVSPDLLGLLGLIAEIPGDFRIGLGSIEPTVVDEGFARRLMEIPKLLPEFHISLQSGSDSILKSMKRPYTMEGFEEIVKIIREKYPEAKIGTDIIVGYPGETEADFEASMDAVRRIGFDHVHVFKYSRRKGTVATEMPNQVSEEVKSKRSKRLIELSGSTK
jgi:threonylcarbamoyladenosine tRNA methylthiotransferase MtaB